MITDHSGLVALRPFEPSDLERTLKWHNDPKLYENLGGSFRPVSRQTEAEWLQRISAWSANAINLAICIAKSGEHIGNIYLRSIDWVARHGELHIFLGEEAQRGKGYGAAAVRSLVDYAIGHLALRRIHLQVLSENIRAIRVYEKCGFVREGLLKEHVFKCGAFKDVVLMAFNAPH